MGTEDKAEQEPVVKAFVVASGEPLESRLGPTKEDHKTFVTAGAISPPYAPDQLCRLYEKSHALPPNVDAYKVNIESFGHHFDPVINLEDEDADEKIADVLLLEKLEASDEDGIPDVTEGEIEERKDVIRKEMRLEKLQLELFFRNCTTGISFVELRMRTRHDEEVIGSGYWEIVRDDEDDVAQINHAPSRDMRLMPLGGRTDVLMNQRISAITYAKRKRRRQFRRFIQKGSGAAKTYFKEFGDPRVMSARTGKYFGRPANKTAALATLKRAEPRARPATEIIHYKIYSANSVCGVPRWVPATLAVYGTREAEEVNASYFEHKAIPPFAILVSGGKLATDGRKMVENYLRDQIIGKKNFHNALVIEAEGKQAQMPGQLAPRIRVEFLPLQQFQQGDALFLSYDARNAEKVRNMFRLPKLLVGDAADVNRATADAAIAYTEQQVFHPLRASRDFLVNEVLFPEMEVRYWRYVSNTPVSTDPRELAEIIAALKNVMPPSELRPVAAELLSRELPEITDAWVYKPPDIYKAELQHGTPQEAGEEETGGEEGEAAEGDLLERLQAIRDQLRETSDAAAADEEEAERAKQRDSVVTLRVSDAEFDAIVEKNAADDDSEASDGADRRVRPDA